MNKLQKILKKRILLLDGATGTNLLDKGLAPGESPSILNLKNPQAVYEIHRAYIDAGSDVILTNTFTANPINISSSKLKKVITEAVKIAKRAAANKAIVIGDVGPLGELIKPYGEMGFNESYKIYYNIFKILYSSGIKTFLIETFTSIIEAKAAFLAAKNFSKDIFISLSLQENGRTIMGEIPESIAVVFEALGAKGVGINCTLPEVAIEAIEKMAKITNLPLIIKP
ncbi:homocysteine methyltransferase, partial [candidate division WOR-3 bacterium]|nr:homocysteine methyltransferase [candidate division WOR-3 bacterium]